MADNTLISYDLNGKKLSFANWISNLSPTDTPFVSMTGKEAIAQTLFQWQTDSLQAVNETNSVIEGSVAEAPELTSTVTLNNVTQILRKVVKVSDTASALANFGRGRELQYQMEKAGKELKRDLEAILLSAQVKDDGVPFVTARRTGAFQSLVAARDVADPDTGAIVNQGVTATSPTEALIFNLTYNLYLSGSKADVIMFHPKHANFFASLQEVSSGNRVKMFEGDDSKFNHYVTEIVDPLGCAYRLIPNRWMPEDSIYFFTGSDWTQMILRTPERTKLAKDGSYEKWMIEMETGLRHRHPYASGILTLGVTPPTPPVTSVTISGASAKYVKVGETIVLAVTVAPAGATQTITTTSSAPTIADKV